MRKNLHQPCLEQDSLSEWETKTISVLFVVAGDFN